MKSASTKAFLQCWRTRVLFPNSWQSLHDAYWHFKRTYVSPLYIENSRSYAGGSVERKLQNLPERHTRFLKLSIFFGSGGGANLGRCGGGHLPIVFISDRYELHESLVHSFRSWIQYEAGCIDKKRNEDSLVWQRIFARSSRCGWILTSLNWSH